MYMSTETNQNQRQIYHFLLNELHPMKNHPYKVCDDDDMKMLTESINEYGILTPIMAHKLDGYNAGYEIISGHRRYYAAQKLQLKEVPVTVTDADENKAVCMMVDSNLNREKVFPSEKAFAYRMKLEAIKRQGERTDLTSAQNEPRSGMTSVELVALEADESRSKVQRYIRLTYLLPELLQMVDDEKINMGVGVSLSYLTADEQTIVYVLIAEGTEISNAQAEQLKAAHQNGTLTEEAVRRILGLISEPCFESGTDSGESSDSEPKPKRTLVKLYLDELYDFFPELTKDKARYTILNALTEWKAIKDKKGQEASEWREQRENTMASA